MSKQLIRDFLIENESDIILEDLSCFELVNLKDKFYREYGKKPRISEAIIFTWMQNYLGKSLENNSERSLVLKSETKYPAQFGNQTLDISIIDENEIRLGISIKMSTSTSAYLDGADFINPFFDMYRNHFVKDEADFVRKRKEGKRISVPTLLQDMARIQNLKTIRPSFPSITIVYSTRKAKDSFWINEFEKFGHQYIFLGEHLNVSFKKILEVKIPLITQLSNR